MERRHPTRNIVAPTKKNDDDMKNKPPIEQENLNVQPIGGGVSTARKIATSRRAATAIPLSTLSKNRISAANDEPLDPAKGASLVQKSVNKTTGWTTTKSAVKRAMSLTSKDNTGRRATTTSGATTSTNVVIAASAASATTDLIARSSLLSETGLSTKKKTAVIATTAVDPTSILARQTTGPKDSSSIDRIEAYHQKGSSSLTSSFAPRFPPQFSQSGPSTQSKDYTWIPKEPAQLKPSARPVVLRRDDTLATETAQTPAYGGIIVSKEFQETTGPSSGELDQDEVTLVSEPRRAATRLATSFQTMITRSSSVKVAPELDKENPVAHSFLAPTRRTVPLRSEQLEKSLRQEKAALLTTVSKQQQQQEASTTGVSATRSEVVSKQSTLRSGIPLSARQRKVDQLEAALAETTVPSLRFGVNITESHLGTSQALTEPESKGPDTDVTLRPEKRSREKEDEKVSESKKIKPSEHSLVLEEESETEALVVTATEDEEEEVVEIQPIEADDPAYESEYSEDIFRYLRELEILLAPDFSFIWNRGEEFWRQRQNWIESMSKICVIVGTLTETLFLAVNLLDRALSQNFVSPRSSSTDSSTTSSSLSMRERHQIAAVACVLIAAKFEERNPHSMAYVYTDYLNQIGTPVDAETFRQCERELLLFLDYKLGWPGPLSFLRRCSLADDGEYWARTTAKYILETVLFDKRFLLYKPSLQAAAALKIGRCMMGRDLWTAILVQESGYRTIDLAPVIEDMSRFLKDPVIPRTTPYQKYMKLGSIPRMLDKWVREHHS